MARSRRPVRLQLTGRRALARAEQLLDSGRAAEAASLMVKTYLRHENPQTATPHEDLVDAVGWYVKAVNADPAAVPEPLAWARWAYAAAHQLHAAGPDLDTLQVGVDVLTHTLLWAGLREDALVVRREAIQVAAARGDTTRARQRHCWLASELLAIGRCAEAADEGLAAIEPTFDASPEATSDDISATLNVYMALESCHRHDAATALAARLGGHPAVVEAVALLSFGADCDDLLSILPPSFQAHAQQHHAGEPCTRLDCPSARGNALGARFYAALLSRCDPAAAEPDVALIRIASRFVLFPEADTQHNADAAAWAGYAHRGTLAVPGSSVEHITVATRLVLAVADRHGYAQTGIDACRAAVAALTGRGGVADVVAVRLQLAQRLHRAGFCDDALTEAAAALTAYAAVDTDRDVTGVTHFMTVSAMFDGCHRHHDLDTLSYDSAFDGAYFNDQNEVLAAWLVVFEDSLLTMLDHTGTFHPDTACAHERCTRNLAAAANIPHERALRHIMQLYDQQRLDEAVTAVRQHLAANDPATSPPSSGLAKVALCHLTNAVEHFPDEPDESVLPWGRYARHAADLLDPDRTTGWTALISMFVRAATLHGEHAEAIAAAAEAIEHCVDRGDAPAAISAQFELAAALHAAGHCDEAREHAIAAWHDTLEHLDPADPEQRLTGLIAGTGLVHHLGDCHQHEQAVAVMTRASITYGAHDTTTGISAGAEERERRWQRANRGFLHRSDRHRTAYHATDPCLTEHEHIDVPIALALQGIPAHTDTILFRVAVFQDTP
ncbi:hypothetical protein AB0M46_00205 [Dactylosporangium sp. NPDC051485]|uniref:hypothetical protein n=1 Tax=Dactylosporangium sp. NPDC051485 TaxID=3154846 RepID=UPI00342409E2